MIPLIKIYKDTNFPKHHQFIVAHCHTALSHTVYVLQNFLNLVLAFFVYSLPLCCLFWISSIFLFLISYVVPCQIRLSYLSAVNFYTVHLPFSVHLKKVNLSWKNTSKNYFQYMCTYVGNQYGIDIDIYLFQHLFVLAKKGFPAYIYADKSVTCCCACLPDKLSLLVRCA